MADGHIHKHLHSMFHLLRTEDRLKMAVKLESARLGRTRYLVVVSCSRKPNQRKNTSQIFNNLMNAQNINNNCINSNSVKNGNGTNRSGSNTNQNNNSELNSNRKSANVSMLLSDDEQIIASTLIAPNKSISTNVFSNSCSNLLATPIKTGTKNLIIEKDLKNLSAANRTANVNASWQQQTACDSDRNSDQEQQNNNDVEESCLLGIDCNEKTSVGLVLRILGDTAIRLDGDGGFCISGSGRTHIFKPVSVQAMWSALQTLHKVCAKARENNFFPGGPSHDWVAYYEDRVFSDRSCLNEWNAMDSLESRRPPSPDAIRNKPTEREETERIIRTALKEIIVQLDLDEVTSKYIRTRLEEHLNMNLTEYKSFIDQEMLIILGQMDAPTKIFDHVYLGSEWNASNLEELQKNGVRHILNVTREIDNFFPGMFDYFNVRVYDDEKTNLLKHWDNTFKYISQVKNEGSKVLVHCKMGVSRSASVVIAYAMKAYDWSFTEALEHVKVNRNCIKPNKNFCNQLETYQGMLLAMKNKEKLQRSKSDTNLRSVKDARLLPGSEPTPLIQAFNAAAKKSNENTLQNRMTNSLNRPKSWSPDSVETAVLMLKQQSQSLENLPPECKETLKSRNNVRLPCKNGQNYSVSQNQVFHLEESSNLMQQSMTNVKLIVNELESNEKRRSEAKVVNKEQWDPGDRSSPNLGENRLLNKPPVSSSASCDRTSPFGSLKRSESNKSKPDSDAQSEKYSPVMKSRSLDVSNAVTTATSTLSTTNPISNKPPFGSPNNRHSMHETSGAISQTSSINTSPAWTRRSSAYNPSRSGSSSSNSSSSSNVSLSGVASDLISDLYKNGSKSVKNLRNISEYSLREKNPMLSISNKVPEIQVVPVINVNQQNLINDNDASETSRVNMTIARFADKFSKDLMQRIKKRCKSDGMLYESDIISTVNKRLSSSSPTEYSDKVIINRSTFPWNNRLVNNKCNFQTKGKRVKNRSLCRTVENLKLNFESKETEPAINIGIAKEPKRGKSLPSSPVASIYASNIASTMTNTIGEPASSLKPNYDKLGCEEINVKGLVDRYEDTSKSKSDTINAFTTTAAANTNVLHTSPIYSNLNARLKRHTIHQSPQHNDQQQQQQKQSFRSNIVNIVPQKPPPIPNSPIVVTAKPPSNILLAKRMHQESQSFARLKQHFNSASAYNTM